jgi:hypothetical protein
MEECSVARQSKREYWRSIHQRYRRASRKKKTAMLEEFCKVCGYNRKYAIWLLSRPEGTAEGQALRCNILTRSPPRRPNRTELTSIYRLRKGVCPSRTALQCSRRGPRDGVGPSYVTVLSAVLSEKTCFLALAVHFRVKITRLSFTDGGVTQSSPAILRPHHS